MTKPTLHPQKNRPGNKFGDGFHTNTNRDAINRVSTIEFLRFGNHDFFDFITLTDGINNV